MLAHNFPMTTPKISKRKAFTTAEDLILISLVNQIGTQSWERIAVHLPNRSARQCRERWISYLSPNITNGPWSTSEDQLLLQLVQQYGTKWTEISRYFINRSDANIKNRYYSHLKPKPKTSSDEAFDLGDPSKDLFLPELDSGMELLFF